MSNKDYINSISHLVTKNRTPKGSKVEERLIDLVNEMIDNKEVTSIKNVTEKLGKVRNYGSYIRLLVTKSEHLKFNKINGINIILPVE